MVTEQAAIATATISVLYILLDISASVTTITFDLL